MLIRTLHAVVAAVALLAPPLSAQTGVAGHWEGTFTAGGRQIALGLDVAQTANGRWIASMSVPAENATGLVVTDLVVDRSSVKFVGFELMMTKFDLVLDADGKLKGTLSGPQGPLPIEFTRTGEAKVELIPPSPAVSKELEGDWEGSLDAGGGRSFPIVVHFSNQADGTVTATMRTPLTTGTPAPLNDVRQAGEHVEFGVRVAHGSFSGTLNSAGTELTGRFTHEESSTPLTLRKRPAK